MRKLLTEIINVLFPPRPTEKILQDNPSSDIYDVYRPGIFNTINFLSHYSNTYVQACIIENKFHHNKSAAKALGKILQQWVATENKKTLFIPIPLGIKRERTRMHNQTMSILIHAGENVHISNALLKRQKETPPQTKLNRVARMKNMKEAFVCTTESFDWADYEQVVIVDDVVTTGATLKAAQEAIAPYLPSHISLRILAIAH
jgi:predicted amidophosphoribosyltransferase